MEPSNALSPAGSLTRTPRPRSCTLQGTVFALARVKQDLLARLESFGLAEKIGADRLFPTLPTAVEAYEQWARQHPPAG
jgi:SulP family sulfate permease